METSFEATTLGFQFVAVTRPGHGWKSGDEHTIRSHAMRHVRRKRKLKLIEEQVKLAGSLPVLARHQSHKERESGDQDNGQPTQLSAARRSRASSRDLVDASSRDHSDRHFIELQRRQPLNHRLSARDHRLLVHISNFYSPLITSISEKFVLWIKGVKQFLAIAFSHDFVLNAILAWSATHLAEMTGDVTVKQDAYRHRCQALKGLQMAVKSFSTENSDAVMCASITLSWQSLDVSGWAIMKRGCETVKRKMASWHKQSSLGSLASGIASQLGSDASFDIKFRTRIHKAPCQCFITREDLLDDAQQSLAALQVYVVEFPLLSGAVNELVAFLDSVKDPLDPSKTVLRSERLKQMRDMLFWFPSRYLPSLNTHPSVMLLMAHLHAIALLIDTVTDGNSARLRSLNAAPIQAFYEEFSMRARIKPQNSESESQYKSAMALMEFPLRAVAYFHYLLTNHYGQFPGNLDVMWDRKNSSMSMLQILEDFPVGLWHNSLS